MVLEVGRRSWLPVSGLTRTPPLEDVGGFHGTPLLPSLLRRVHSPPARPHHNSGGRPAEDRSSDRARLPTPSRTDYLVALPAPPEGLIPKGVGGRSARPTRGSLLGTRTGKPIPTGDSIPPVIGTGHLSLRPGGAGVVSYRAYARVLVGSRVLPQWEGNRVRGSLLP